MVMYKIKLTDTAESDLAKLDKPVALRVVNRLQWLADNFETLSPIPLTGHFRGDFKLRAGDYRVLYNFDRLKKVITVHIIDHLSRVYKRR